MTSGHGASNIPVPTTVRAALVTGGSSGIGLAVAAALARLGTGVVITGRDEDRLRAAVDRIGAGGTPGGLLAVRADVRLAGDAERVVQAAVEHFGDLDILVNNAGVGRWGSVSELPVEAWAEVLDTNLTGVFHTCRAVLPVLRRRGGGWIINISSLAGQNPFAGGAAYCASKAGLNAFTEALMQEVRHDGIRVSLVLPGSVATNFRGGGGATAEWALQPEDVAQVVVDLVGHEARSLPSRVEIRPSRPPKKG
ncbi:MAG: SDR family oxidoreductase [Vicinamibacterales bacterium]